MNKATTADEILASPTKRFFVDMLTRDIELKDAVLDLLDNCVDGLMRTLGPNLEGADDKARPYAGYWADLAFSERSFRIRDNCGGISRSLAQNSAFRLGRPKGASPGDDLLPTVGTYGIGMKRAIFKIGRECEVISRTKADAFKVVIPKMWFSDEDEWSLKLHAVARQPGEAGTTITVKQLLPEVALGMGDPVRFPTEFEQAVSQQYSLIIAKGFEVRVDGKPICPMPLQLRTVDLESYTGGLAPYMYRGTVDGVDVSLSVGFYKHSPDEAELEAMEDNETYSAEEAGWTVVCNDRVVLYRDKTRLTGWGEAGVPSFHNQFNSIAGVVHFRSNDASRLPVNTTKRGIDPGSDVFLKVKDRMRDGLKKFTSYTNKLKRVPDKRAEVFGRSRPVNVTELRIPKRSSFVRDDRKLGGKVFDPELPAVSPGSLKTIRYSKPASEIEKIAKRLIEDPEATPSEVGEFCFSRVLSSLEKDRVRS